MRPRTLVAVAFVLLGTATCVRLGFWQLGRWHEKQRLNAALRETLASPPLEVLSGDASHEGAIGRRVTVRGHFDERRQLLLSARVHDGSPGVEVVTPFVLPGGGAVLVNRGWLYAPDAATALPQDHPEPGDRAVTGIAEPARRGAPGPPLRTLLADSVTLWSARWIDLDSLGARLPYTLAPYVVRQLPGPGVPASPVRSAPKPYDEMMHFSYAVQWFVFATILFGGSLVLARARRRSRGISPVVPPVP